MEKLIKNKSVIVLLSIILLGLLTSFGVIDQLVFKEVILFLIKTTLI